jgi:hypothetical protein
MVNPSSADPCTVCANAGTDITAAITAAINLWVLICIFVLSAAKIQQTERRKKQVYLIFYPEAQRILFKDTANREEKKQVYLIFILRRSVSYLKITTIFISWAY